MNSNQEELEEVFHSDISCERKQNLLDWKDILIRAKATGNFTEVKGGCLVKDKETTGNKETVWYTIKKASNYDQLMKIINEELNELL